MTPTFPLAERGARGYSTDEVDRFLRFARLAYDGADERAAMTATDIRHTAFAVVTRGGYDPVHVDAALERLEDAFAQRERDLGIQQMGSAAWVEFQRETAQVIVNRLARPAGRRFARTGPLARGYKRSAVDAFADVVSDYFQRGRALDVETVRRAAFPLERGGYREDQVDAVLDAVVSVMLAVR